MKPIDVPQGEFKRDPTSLEGHYATLPFRVKFCIDAAAYEARVMPLDLLRKGNRPKFVKPRHRAMLLVSEIEEVKGVPVFGPKRIGEFFLRHHSSVIYGIRRAKESDPTRHLPSSRKAEVS